MNNHPTIGRYELKEEIGRGGMAVVYRGYDPRFKREVAIKMMTVDFVGNPALLARFEREAQTIAALEHPAIIPVYDFGEEHGRPYLVMRLMGGGTLADKLHEGALTLGKTAAILHRICGALARAHEKGIIHRDLKPNNIMYDEYGEPYLGDFGIARLADTAVSLTSGSLIGTPAYMSPEQINGDKALDGRSDIYALGVVCFEMLTGRQPFQSDTMARTMMKHLLEPVPDIHALKPELPRGVTAVLTRALAKKAEERFAIATELADALANLLRATPDDGTVVMPANKTLVPEPPEPAPADDLDMGYWFPYTKLHPPQLGTNMAPRSRPQALLAKAVREHKVTLVAAPGGSGKTSLTATLTEGKLPVAWIALDAADDDVAAFTAVVVAALRPYLRDDGRAILNFLQNVPNAHEKTARLAALVINNLRPQTAAVLILDDYHVISDSAIHDFVAYVVDYLPPTLRLVIATRHDPPLPLPRWRSRGELGEIRLSQIRFDEAETAAFLQQRHQLDLSEEEVAALQQHTEGWAAGLQLLAAVLATMPAGAERLAYIERLGTVNRSIFDLLASEVLSLQTDDIQEFLLQTCILPELTPANCRAVTENPKAGSLLNDVYRRNLFLIPLTRDTHGGPFRYHDLFRVFLQQRLKEERPEEWRELHGRAAHAAVSDEQKLHHLTSAERWEEVAQLLEQMGQLDSQRRFTRRVVIKGIQNLPDEVHQTHPWLLFFMAQYYALRGQADAAAPWVAQAQTCFRETGDELGEIELLFINALLEVAVSDTTVQAFRQKIATSSHLMRPDHWATYHGTEVWHAFETYNWVAITEHMQANMRKASASGDLGAMTVVSMTIAPQMLFYDGSLNEVEAFIKQLLPLATPEDWILQICAHGLAGALHFFAGRVVEAEQAARVAHGLLVEIGGVAWVDQHVCWVLLAGALARGDYAGFDAFLAEQWGRWEGQETAAVYRPGILYLKGRSLWLRQQIEEAQAVADEIQAILVKGDSGAYIVEDKERSALLSGLLAMARGEMDTAEHHFREAITLHETVRHTMMLSHPRLALATLYGEQERWEEALAELEGVLAELKMRQMPGVVLQEGRSIVPLLRYVLAQGVEVEMLRPLCEVLETGGNRPFG